MLQEASSLHIDTLEVNYVQGLIHFPLFRDENYSQCRLNCPGPDEGDWDCNTGGDGSFMTPEEQEIQATLYAGLMQTCIDLGPTVCTAFQVLLNV